MAGDRDALFQDWIARARAVPILDVVARANVTLRGTSEKTGPCPGCGGRDRFGYNVRDDVWSCRQGGGDPIGGDVIALTMHVESCDFLEAVERLTGEPPPRGEGMRLSPEEVAAREKARADRAAAAEAAQNDFRERERRRCIGFYADAHPAPGSAVEAYLRLRSVSLPRSATIRCAPRFPLWDERTVNGQRKTVKVHEGPAMIAAIAGPDGRLAGVHITWIDLADPEGKARVTDPETGEVTPAKKMRGSAKRGHIRLTNPASPTRLVVGEGIETTLSVRQAEIAQGRDVSTTAYWSALSLGNLGGRHAELVRHPTERRLDAAGRSMPVRVAGPVPDLSEPGIPVPDSVVEIITLGDGDSEPVLTRYAHERAAARWAAPGRTIRAVFAPPGHDFNSLLRGLA